jgi:hypothetical protein
MKLQVKNVRVNLDFSEETICFKADIYINGIKACYASNEGHGGCTGVWCYDSVGKSLMIQAEDFLSKTPPVVHIYKDETWEEKQTLTTFIDDYIDDHVKAMEHKKFSKKINKDMEKGIVVSNNNLESYSLVSWKGHMLSDILRRPDGELVLKNTINEYKHKGYTIHNTNLPHYLMN